MSLSRALLPLRQHARGTARLSAVVAALPSTSRYLIPGRFGAAVRKMSMSAAALEETYSGGMQFMHWAMAAGFGVCIATVKVAQNTKGETKGRMMMLHKSTALLVLGMLAPRLALRFTSKIPAHIPGNALEVAAGKLSHVALYGLMIFMPVSGVSMGYFGGKGIPFFGITHIKGADEPKGDIAKWSFQNHKLAGQALTYLVPIHIGAVGFHYFKGQNLLRRMGLAVL